MPNAPRRYLRRNTARVVDDHEGRLKAVEFGNGFANYRSWRDGADTLTVSGDGSNFTVAFNKWQISDPRIFIPNTAVNGHVISVDLQLPGVYAVMVEISYTDSGFLGPTELTLNDLNDATVDVAYFNYFSNLGLQVSPFLSTTRCYPKTETGEGPFTPPCATLAVNISQNSGGSEDIDGDQFQPCRFEIVYMGGWQDAAVQTA